MLQKVNLHSDVPVFAQLVNEVRFAIASGRLQPGDRLPAVRGVAESLEINPNTVAKAYRDLEITGLVSTRRGLGVFIREGVAAKCRTACYLDTARKLHEAVAEARASGMQEDDILNITRKCFHSKASPYDNPPAGVTALARVAK